jgi:IclR family acetate operon transcriptional repressor
MMTSASTARQVSAMVMRTLELAAPEREGLRVSTLAIALGVNKAIAHRIVTALVEVGYLEQVAGSGAYRPTFALGALGLRQIESADTESWAQPVLESLAGLTRELVRLSMATGDAVHWVAKAEGTHSRLRIDPAMGRSVVLYATASGKAWLSGLEAARVSAILAAISLEPQTPWTNRNLESILAEIDQARERGFAVTVDEMDEGISAVAAPVFHARGGEAVGAVSVAGPSLRLSREALEEMSPAVIEAAERLGRAWAVRFHVTGGTH